MAIMGTPKTAVADGLTVIMYYTNPMPLRIEIIQEWGRTVNATFPNGETRTYKIDQMVQEDKYWASEIIIYASNIPVPTYTPGKLAHIPEFARLPARVVSRQTTQGSSEYPRGFGNVSRNDERLTRILLEFPTVQKSVSATIQKLESDGNLNIQDSTEGAQCAYQVMPGTSRSLGHPNVRVHDECFRAGNKNIAEHMQRFGSADWMALAYHGVPRAVASIKSTFGTIDNAYAAFIGKDPRYKGVMKYIGVRTWGYLFRFRKYHARWG